MDLEVPETKIVFVVDDNPRKVQTENHPQSFRAMPLFVHDNIQLSLENSFVVIDSERSLRITLPVIVDSSLQPVEIRTVQNTVTHFVSTESDLMHNGSQSIRLGVGGKNVFVPKGNVWYMV